LKSEDLCILSTKKNNLGLDDYQKLRKRKDENIISSVGKKMRVSSLFLAAPLFSSSSFLLSEGKPNSLHSY
jgi:hypothetical protein